MDEEIIRRWNEVVEPEDIVYHLGDIAMGTIVDSLPKVARLNGYKVAVLGNHDRPFMRMNKSDEIQWWERYEEFFDVVWNWYGIYITEGEEVFRLSHFPFTGDHTPEDRHVEHRPVDSGIPLIHGHTHSTDRLTFSAKGTPQVHVGQDAWDYRPVSLGDVLHLIRKSQS